MAERRQTTKRESEKGTLLSFHAQADARSVAILREGEMYSFERSASSGSTGQRMHRASPANYREDQSALYSQHSGERERERERETQTARVSWRMKMASDS